MYFALSSMHRELLICNIPKQELLLVTYSRHTQHNNINILRTHLFIREQHAFHTRSHAYQSVARRPASRSNLNLANANSTAYKILIFSRISAIFLDHEIRRLISFDMIGNTENMYFNLRFGDDRRDL